MEVDTHISIQWLLGAAGVMVLQGIGLVIWFIKLQTKTESNTEKIGEHAAQIKENTNNDSKRDKTITGMQKDISQMKYILILLAKAAKIEIPKFE